METAGLLEAIGKKGVPHGECGFRSYHVRRAGPVHRRDA